MPYHNIGFKINSLVWRTIRQIQYSLNSEAVKLCKILKMFVSPYLLFVSYYSLANYIKDCSFSRDRQIYPRYKRLPQNWCLLLMHMCAGCKLQVPCRTNMCARHRKQVKFEWDKLLVLQNKTTVEIMKKINCTVFYSTVREKKLKELK